MNRSETITLGDQQFVVVDESNCRGVWYSIERDGTEIGRMCGNDVIGYRAREHKFARYLKAQPTKAAAIAALIKYRT